MSSINKKSCWDTGDILGRNKAPWTLSLYKASRRHITLRKQEGSCTARCWLQTSLGDIQQTTGEHQTSCSIPPAIPGINQHSPLGRLNPPRKTKQNKTKNWINKELKTNTQQRGWGAVSTPEKGGKGKELISVWTSSKQRLERQKGHQRVGDKLLPEIEQVAVHKTHLLSQWATSKVKWHCKIEK
jgi:hypothetical protein